MRQKEAGHSGRRQAVDGHVSENRLVSPTHRAEEIKMRGAINVSDAYQENSTGLYFVKGIVWILIESD